VFDAEVDQISFYCKTRLQAFVPIEEMKQKPVFSINVALISCLAKA
jgi:hypothetical protein